jgi:signal transduction histidine kinase
LQRVLQLMRQVTDEGRVALGGLRATEADVSSLEQAFSRLPQELAIDDRIGFRVITRSIALPVRSPIRDELYRIGREALINAFHHAQPNRIEVEVEYAKHHLRVAVRDDGRGIDPDILSVGREGHWGLTGMRERSEAIGGTLRLRSRAGAGTEVEVTIPGAIAYARKPADSARGPRGSQRKAVSIAKRETETKDHR